MEDITWHLIFMRFNTKQLLHAFCFLLFAICLLYPNISHADIIPTVDEQIEIIGKPTHQIKIPGLSYTEVKKVEEGDGTYLYVPFIGEYLSATYRYLIVVAGLVAVIVIIVAGIQWTASGGNSSTIESAKNRIIGALTGLGLAVGSYVILYTINPDLVNFRSLKIKYIDTQEIDYSQFPSDYSGSATAAIPANAELGIAAVSAAKGQGCGKGLPEIAAGFAGQTICQGPNHCANFASRVLALSGCGSSYQSNSAGALRDKLKAQGWEIINGKAGVKPGDVVFWGTSSENGQRHVEISVSTDGTTIGSSIYMPACWQGKKKEIEKECGNFHSVFMNGTQNSNSIVAFPYLKDATSIKWTYSECVAKFNVCPPWGSGFEDLCAYCAKIGPPSEFYNPKGEGQMRQCVQQSKGGWKSYARNPINN